MATCNNCAKLEENLTHMTSRALKAEGELKEMEARCLAATQRMELMKSQFNILTDTLHEY